MFGHYKFNRWDDPIRDINIAILRYKGWTYIKLGNNFNISSSRARQICHQVQRKIRSNLYKNNNELYEQIYEENLINNKDKYLEILEEFKRHIQIEYIFNYI